MAHFFDNDIKITDIKITAQQREDSQKETQGRTCPLLIPYKSWRCHFSHSCSRGALPDGLLRELASLFSSLLEVRSSPGFSFQKPYNNQPQFRARSVSSSVANKPGAPRELDMEAFLGDPGMDSAS